MDNAMQGMCMWYNYVCVSVVQVCVCVCVGAGECMCGCRGMRVLMQGYCQEYGVCVVLHAYSANDGCVWC